MGFAPKRKRPLSSALETVMRLLARRDHSRFDLARKLKLRNYESEEIEAALNRAEELHLLQEDHYVRLKVRALHRQGWAARGIAAKLSLEKIKVEVSRVNSILKDEGLDEEELLKKLIKKGRRPHSLSARGFSWDAIARMIRTKED